MKKTTLGALFLGLALFGCIASPEGQSSNPAGKGASEADVGAPAGRPQQPSPGPAAIALSDKPKARPKSPSHDAAPHVTSDIRGCYGTYANPPRGEKQQKDFAKLADQLVELHVNTYCYLIYHDASDWDDLKDFLPLARDRGILVWVQVMPPSGSAPHRSNYSEPFRLDYERWAAEIARLSNDYDNLVAWSIDDFTTDLDTFTPARMKAIRAAAKRENPRLAFIPCCYYGEVTEDFAKTYGRFIDGVLFPYRDESSKHYNVTNAADAAREIKHLKAVLGPGVPVILDVYSALVGKLGESTPTYVHDLMAIGEKSADGIMVHRHPEAGSEKYKVIGELFGRWNPSPAALQRDRDDRPRSPDSDRPQPDRPKPDSRDPERLPLGR